MFKYHKSSLTIILLMFLSLNKLLLSAEKPLIFPIPYHLELLGGSTEINENTTIIEPSEKHDINVFITNLLQKEFGDKYGVPLKVQEMDKISVKQRYILIGTLANKVIKDYCDNNKLIEKVNKLGEEGYLLIVDDKGAVIASKGEKGALYGFESLRQIITKSDNGLTMVKVMVEDKPVLPIRGIRMFLPGHRNIAFFKRFVRDFVAKYKYNTIIMEVNANMRLRSHPEFNTGTIEFANNLDFSRRGRPAGKSVMFQTSSHHDAADGEILEKEEVAELVQYINSFHIEIIPEIPSLTHTYYMLFGHKELAELPEVEYPDTYCPLKPQNYKNYFDVLNEYIEVFQPKIINIGHDEWRMEKDVCTLCKGKDYGELFANDVIKISEFLKEKGIRTAMWGDHLLESVREKKYRNRTTKTGYKYKIPAALTREQVKELIPKDILILNWFWGGEIGDINNDLFVSELGFQQLYGNFRPKIKGWDDRLSIKGLMGGAPSSWAATNEINIGKDLLYDFIGCANLLWSTEKLSSYQVSVLTQKLVPGIRDDFSGEVLPSRLNIDLPMKQIDLNANFNSSLDNGLDSIDTKNLVKGKINDGNRVFNISVEGKGVVVNSSIEENKSNEVTNIQIDEDVSSIIFLHACGKEAINKKAYKMICNSVETAELIGWYEAVYEDGFIETIPIRYGINILDWQTRRRLEKADAEQVDFASNSYAYRANLVPCATNEKTPIDFFAFEWKNSRFGKKIKTINLKAVNSKEKHENSIILLSISTIGKKNRVIATGKETE